MKQKRPSQSGFTLIELMIVLFILGLLTALVAPRLMGRVGKAKQKTAQTQIHMLGHCLGIILPGHRALSHRRRGVKSPQPKSGQPFRVGEDLILTKTSPKIPGAMTIFIKFRVRMPLMILFLMGLTRLPGEKGRIRISRNNLPVWPRQGHPVPVKEQAGFTLLELTIVLFLMTLMLGVVGTNLL